MSHQASVPRRYQLAFHIDLLYFLVSEVEEVRYKHLLFAHLLKLLQVSNFVEVGVAQSLNGGDPLLRRVDQHLLQ